MSRLPSLLDASFVAVLSTRINRINVCQREGLLVYRFGDGLKRGVGFEGPGLYERVTPKMFVV